MLPLFFIRSACKLSLFMCEFPFYLLWDIFFVCALPLAVVSAEVYSGSLTLPASPHLSSLPSHLLPTFFGHTVLHTCSSLSIYLNSAFAALHWACGSLGSPSVAYQKWPLVCWGVLSPEHGCAVSQHLCPVLYNQDTETEKKDINMTKIWLFCCLNFTFWWSFVTDLATYVLVWWFYVSLLLFSELSVVLLVLP